MRRTTEPPTRVRAAIRSQTTAWLRTAVPVLRRHMGGEHLPAYASVLGRIRAELQRRQGKGR